MVGGNAQKQTIVRSLLLAAVSLSFCACVTHFDVPAGGPAGADLEANAALGGKPAVLKLRSGGEDERAVLSARFDGDGDLVVKTEETVEGREPTAKRVEWTTVPRDDLFKIGVVDHDRGALKGYVLGASLGFVPTTLSIFSLLNSGGCKSTPAGPDDCPHPSGTYLAVSALVGLGVGIVTGFVGALVGSVVGDHIEIEVAPDKPKTAATLR